MSGDDISFELRHGQAALIGRGTFVKPRTSLLIPALAVAVLVAFMGKALAQSELLTFDDLNGLEAPIANVYGGLQWSNFSAFDTQKESLGPNGAINGMASPNNVAYNDGGWPASISGGLFNLNSAYLMAMWNDGLQVEVQGFVGGTMTYDNTYTVGTQGSTLITFDYLGVDKVEFISSGGVPHGFPFGSGTVFAMDNLSATIVSNIPGPPTIWSYTNINGMITITGYSGPGGAVTIPSTTNGLPVVALGGYILGVTNATVTSATIPNSVVEIGNQAFATCVGLTNVDLGANVASIGDSAFSDCLNLHAVFLPGSLTNLGQTVFSGCSRLRTIEVASSNPNYSSVDGVLFDKNQTTLIAYPGGKGASYIIPSGVRRIGLGAFQFCRQLNSVVIPDTVTNIADYAFYTSGLTNLSIPGTVNSIGNSAFAYCPFLSNVQLGTGIVTIGDGAFISAQLLTSLVIPDSVKVIGDQTFYDLISLTNLVIGSQVLSIGWGAFDGDAMTSVIIPASVTNIGIGAFEFCNNLQAFYFKGSPPTIGQSSLGDNPLVRIYYLPGTGGWSSSFGGLVTQPWVLPNPIILSPSQQGNQFGFTISWATNLPVVVEASTDLMKPGWQPLQTNALIGGSFYFRDAQSTNYPGRFYRVRSP